jgi:hypothetical protein
MGNCGVRANLSALGRHSAFHDEKPDDSNNFRKFHCQNRIASFPEWRHFPRLAAFRKFSRDYRRADLPKGKRYFSPQPTGAPGIRPKPIRRDRFPDAYFFG